MGCHLGHIMYGTDGDFFIYWIRVRTWTDDPKVIELQIIERYMHGLGYLWCFTELKLNAIAAPAMQKKKIKLGTAIGRPEICLGGPHNLHELIECETLPRGADTGMAPETRLVNDI